MGRVGETKNPRTRRQKDERDLTSEQGCGRTEFPWPGFLDSDEKLDWERWTPIFDTLIVVDYVGSKPIRNQPAFRWLDESMFLRLGNCKQRTNGSCSRSG
jgi:hypothetical protein